MGNDVVDLAAPGNPGKSGDGRFCGRVFTAEERVLIAGAPRPDTVLWALWAAKEAAYKAVSRGDPRVCSVPQKYRVVLEGERAAGETACLAGSVITPRGKLALRILLTQEWVHALAAESEEALDRLYRWVEAPEEDTEPSAFVREGLLREIARLLDCGADELSVINDPGCPAAPGVLFRGRPLTTAVSLSHDGRFAAFAFDPLALIFSGFLC
ncbi:MAG: 4'-phosphopantetheinyl transferase superfamily protein [Deltaproteobacteria bacterium]|nr:4'-phosphopantetheinyl transferase superfamily protein [Deltaproteobacteria bacterium]